MCEALGIDPAGALTALEASNGRFFSYLSDDWTLLRQLLLEQFRPLQALLSDWKAFAKAVEWMEQNKPATRTESLVQADPEPVLAELLGILARMSSVALIYWYFGFPPPEYSGQLAIRVKFQGDPMVVSPGGRLASEAGHSIIRPIHQFLTGLREPRYQLDFAYASEPVRGFLREIPEQVLGANLWLSDPALLVLKQLAGFCGNLRVDPSPLHLTWAALKCPDELLNRALEKVDLDRLELDLEKELFGFLPDARLSVDGLELGVAADTLGALRQISRSAWLTQRDSLVHLNASGKVVRVRGVSLGCGGDTLLSRESRPSQIERLLGIGRQDRWTPIYEGWIKVDTDQGLLEWVSLSEH